MLTTEDIAVMRKCVYNDQRFRADVEISVATIAGLSESGLAVTLSQLATGSDNLGDLSYRVVDFKGDVNSTLVIEVSGDASEVIKELDTLQLV